MNHGAQKGSAEPGRRSFRLSLMGDVFLGGGYTAKAAALADDLFAGIAPTLRGSDIVFGNFEGIVSAAEGVAAGETPLRKVRMAVDPAYLRGLRSARFNVLSLSNNHVDDGGPTARSATIDALAAIGCTVFGAGADAEEAGSMAVRRLPSLSIGFIGFTSATTHPGAGDGQAPGVALLESADTFERVQRAKAGCDLLVVSLHWGDEHMPWPSPEQIRVGRRLIECGADIVAGHHAHVFQGWERWGGGAIFYGLGGITVESIRQRVQRAGRVEDYRFDPAPMHRRSVVAQVSVVDGRVADCRLLPVWIAEDGRPRSERAPVRMMSYTLARWVWRLPGYPRLYRARAWIAFRALPVLRLLLSSYPWRKLVRHWS
jgi:Bacterial capsule synthesis protein PGA_cap